MDDSTIDALAKYVSDAILASDWLARMKADAWDEGHEHCFRVENPANKVGNPYRKGADHG